VAPDWSIDTRFPAPRILQQLAGPENARLRHYVENDPFGAHFFPGSEGCTGEEFLAGADEQLTEHDRLFLWAYVPLCRYRCAFCQFPLFVTHEQPSKARAQSRLWVDLNLAELDLWLARLPKLSRIPVDHFSLFGGTPTELPPEELRRLIQGYRDRLAITDNTVVRVEGSPDSLTRTMLVALRELGVHQISMGIQSFDERLLALAGRDHTASQTHAAISACKELGFQRVTGDLIYGLLDQTVDSFLADVEAALQTGLDAIVLSKLHLAAFSDHGTAISGRAPAIWQRPSHRALLAARGHSWPSLGMQYQMRELAVQKLTEAGFYESPAMYFQRSGTSPEHWKTLMMHPNHQIPELGVGFGGLFQSRTVTSTTSVDRTHYITAVRNGTLPISPKRIPPQDRTHVAFKKAVAYLSPIPLSTYSSAACTGAPRALGPTIESLVQRGFASIVREHDQLVLSESGKTLAEAIANVEVCP
jgi:oxygen-independent coproporphyrinogen-3 oxidase